MQPPIHVSPRLQQPLYIDTDINYNLDMSKFPGLDDPQHMYQPALLIATPHNNTVSSYCKDRNCDTNSSQCHPIVPCMEPSARNVLEELLNIIDSCGSELLDRLMDTSIQTQDRDNLYKNLMDSCVNNPQNILTHPETHRVEGDTNNRTRTDHVISDQSIMMDYYNGLHKKTPSCSSTTDLLKCRWSYSAQNVLQRCRNRQDYVDNRLDCKRKRSVDTCENTVVKRLCNVTRTVGYSGYSDEYTRHYQRFQETLNNRGLVV